MLISVGAYYTPRVLHFSAFIRISNWFSQCMNNASCSDCQVHLMVRGVQCVCTYIWWCARFRNVISHTHLPRVTFRNVICHSNYHKYGTKRPWHEAHIRIPSITGTTSSIPRHRVLYCHLPTPGNSTLALPLNQHNRYS